MLPHCSAQSTSKGLCLFAMFAPYPFGLSKVRYLGCCRGPLCCDDIRLSDVWGFFQLLKAVNYVQSCNKFGIKCNETAGSLQGLISGGCCKQARLAGTKCS